jgi:predicted DNA-binding protein (UPF0251 family)
MRPFGCFEPTATAVCMTLDEYEALRWLDYVGVHQEQAAEKMGVSRPTLTRIYESARKKLSTALVEGKTVVIQGGDVCFDRKWFRCRRCHKLIAGLENHQPCEGCDAYCSEELEEIR